MSCVAVLVWYDEPPALLTSCVRSWARMCDAVVALDGAWEGFPEGEPASDWRQANAIEEACRREGMTSVVLSPAQTWDSQAEKRSAALAIAEAITTPDDWYFILDGDERIHVGDRRTLLALDEAKADAGVIHAQIGVGSEMEYAPQPRLMRAIRGMRVEGLHYRYTTPSTEPLWNYPGEPENPNRLHVDVRLWHMRDARPEARNAAAKAYYQQRQGE